MSELLGFLKAQKSSRGARMVLNTLDNKDLENGDGRGDDEKASCSYIKTINGMKVNDHETCYDTSDSGSAGLIEHNTLENESNEFLEESDCSVRDPDYEPSSSSKNGNSDQENYDLADERNITELDIEVLERKERTRWRRSNSSGWKKNKVKKMKIEQRQPKQVNCSRCRFTCSKKISEETRRRICTVFWNCDFKRQKDFILNYVESTPPVRRRIRNENGTSVQIGDGGIFQGEDKRGRKAPSNKTREEDVQRVKSHIERFPAMESHYTRKSSRRKYLDSKLSIAKMYSLYKELCENENRKPVSLITYRRIFCNNYNLSFYKPKKDQCQMCVKFNAATEEKKQQLEEEYNAHIKRKQDCYEAKVRDKARSMEDKEFMCCTFDLQCVLQIPSSDVSPMYYARKICTYNLTIYELPPPNNAYCYLWTEMNGKRGSTEIGSCLYYYLQQLSETFKEITLYSDTCGGQNRNQNVAALCLFLVQTTRLTVIEHKFLESGHSYMEVDSMHSAIEHQQKFVPVYTVQDWINVFHLARSQRKKKNAPPYNVRELKFSDFFDLSQLSKLIMKNKSRKEYVMQ
nr:unnamed protein product [Callosobruchus chinensis]